MTALKGAGMTEKRIDPETISGTVDSVTYRNDENGFAVIVLDYNGDPLTVVGA